MKVIFLDIDGVLNTEIYIAAFWDICKQLELSRADANLLKRLHLNDRFGVRFDPMAVRALNWVVESTGAKIVISSTWRLAGLENMKEMWEERKLPGEIIDITPSLLNQRGTTLCRGEEVHMWIKEWEEKNKGEKLSYVAIDDDSDLLPLCEGHFVKTDYQYGLTIDLAERCIEILTKNE